MKDNRFRFGLIATIAWLGLMTWQWYSVGLPDKLNERGVFFAGFFAPLAFLWLVLGYLQQGEELRQSTEALRLQAEELRNSVEQQSQLVEVSRRQLEQEAHALQEERQRHTDALRPRFQLSHNGYAGANGYFNVPLVFRNEGGASVDTTVLLTAPNGKVTVVSHELIRRGGERLVVVNLTNGHWQGEIEWKDESGNLGRELFALRMDGSTLLFDQPTPSESSHM
ncbi:hypothetical protein NYO99_09180 [Pelomonas sp. UHG3]|uniref:Uncharacterized protein n=1 Tax=Roseateles hydrophilus TaxID=2975054 RepID=A0ACC6C9R2_9BURK|nr:hypothetical protein [Pelomonas sp. UHG3]MCY4745141.1 hypothetical protein [Pelomonas sp. UHG3]